LRKGGSAIRLTDELTKLPLISRFGSEVPIPIANFTPMSAMAAFYEEAIRFAFPITPRPTPHPRPIVSAEVELKLLASPAAIERLRAATVITQHARNRGVVRRLEAVYYDTPDRALSASAARCAVSATVHTLRSNAEDRLPNNHPSRDSSGRLRLIPRCQI
jgi:hypothetical protein